MNRWLRNEVAPLIDQGDRPAREAANTAARIIENVNALCVLSPVCLCPLPCAQCPRPRETRCQILLEKYAVRIAEAAARAQAVADNG